MLLFATGNRHKFEEVSLILVEFGLEAEQKEFPFREINSENAKEIALDKARQAFEKFRQPLIVEDTAFYFKAYSDFPGTQPKRMFEALGYDGFFRLLKGKSREAFSLCTICFIESPESHRFFEGRLEGRITEKVIKPKANVMPYEKIFIPKGSKKALAELSRTEKNALSHRGIAARKLGEWLKEKALHDLVESI